MVAICDANYCFTMFDVGQFGSNNDSGILLNSEMGMAFEFDKLKVLRKSVINIEIGALPYFQVSDEIFRFKRWLMRPYPGTELSCEKRKSTIILSSL